MKKTTRGSTLIETMLASSVLLLGMVGVVQLILSGVNQNAMSNARATGQDLASAGAAAAMSVPFAAMAGLPTATFIDAGVLFDGDGRRYGRRLRLFDLGDGGTRMRLVEVTTDWQDKIGALSLSRSALVTVIVSEIPDAGF